MDKHVAAQYIQRHFNDRYAQLFELMTRDAQSFIDKRIKEVTPKTIKGMRIKYEVIVQPNIIVRNVL